MALLILRSLHRMLSKYLAACPSASDLRSSKESQRVVQRHTATALLVPHSIVQAMYLFPLDGLSCNMRGSLHGQLALSYCRVRGWFELTRSTLDDA